jgi:hypothetical protein
MCLICKTNSNYVSPPPLPCGSGTDRINSLQVMPLISDAPGGRHFCTPGRPNNYATIPPKTGSGPKSRFGSCDGSCAGHARGHARDCPSQSACPWGGKQLKRKAPHHYSNHLLLLFVPLAHNRYFYGPPVAHECYFYWPLSLIIGTFMDLSRP